MIDPFGGMFSRRASFDADAGMYSEEITNVTFVTCYQCGALINYLYRDEHYRFHKGQDEN